MLSKDASRLQEQLRGLFHERCTKTDLLLNLRKKLIKFPLLRNTPFQDAINDFILKRAEEDCEILLDDNDIRKIWSDK